MSIVAKRSPISATAKHLFLEFFSFCSAMGVMLVGLVVALVLRHYRFKPDALLLPMAEKCP